MSKLNLQAMVFIQTSLPNNTKIIFCKSFYLKKNRQISFKTSITTKWQAYNS